MRDGIRRVTHVTEVVGMEGDVITTQDLFTYEFRAKGRDGSPDRRVSSQLRLRPYFLTRAAYYGLDRALLEAMRLTGSGASDAAQSR